MLVTKEDRLAKAIRLLMEAGGKSDLDAVWRTLSKKTKARGDVRAAYDQRRADFYADECIRLMGG